MPCNTGLVPDCWENERGGSPAPAAEPRHADLASMANDPYVAVLSQESQAIFGKGISRNELQRLVDLYQIDGWKPDVILLGCAEVARLGRRTVGGGSRPAGPLAGGRR